MLNIEKYPYIYNFILHYFEYIYDLEIIESYDTDVDSEYDSDEEIFY